MRTINFGRYNPVSTSRAGVDLPKSDNKIAVIYSSGMILPEMAQSPFSTSSGITPENVQKQFERALDDDNVKAIVLDRKSTRLNSSHVAISYAVFRLKKKT